MVPTFLFQCIPVLAIAGIWEMKWQVKDTCLLSISSASHLVAWPFNKQTNKQTNNSMTTKYEERSVEDATGILQEEGVRTSSEAWA